MSCPRYRDSIVLLVDGELSDDAAHGVRTHLTGCDDCRAMAAELERLAVVLTPATPDRATMDETRFWRKFDADLAVRVARGETPWWKRSITIPVPAMAGVAVVVVCTGLVAGRYHRRAADLEARTHQLQAILREARESTIFPASVRVPRDLQERLDEETPVGVAANEAMSAAAAPMTAPARTLPASAMKAFSPGRQPQPRPRNSIRFVDSDGVLQPGDLY